mgnify:FL=1
MKSNISTLNRLNKAYLTIGHSFGIWISPIFSGLLISILRLMISLGMFMDKIFYPSIRKRQITNPIVIVGNPRSGTTFLHRFLVKNKIGAGAQLWQLLYPSVLIQNCIRPLLPILELISPTRHHSTEAHKTSLRSVETDDASILFRYFDGFFLYGFILSWAEEDLFEWFDPKIRDTSARDFNWLESIWRRVLKQSSNDKIIAKLFSISANLPKFMTRFPDAKILYMVRDPLSVIPSGISLVTGVLDKRFGFWNLPDEKRKKYIERLYKALVTLLVRFHDDWVNNRIDRSKVMIVHFDKMMNNFDGLMTEIFQFLNQEPSTDLMKSIQQTAESQKTFKSKHQYDLEKFGLSTEQIRSDCSKIYETFLK